MNEAGRVELLYRHHQLATAHLVVAVDEVADVERVHETRQPELLVPERDDRVAADYLDLGDPREVLDHLVG